MFDRIRARIKEILAKPKTAAERAAPRIEAKLKRDATTRRGNIPSFSPGGPDVPIAVTASGDEIKVGAVDWVLEKANEKGQPAEWAEIVREEVRR
jgi:hypothetical protein